MHFIFFAKVSETILPNYDIGTCLMCLGWPALTPSSLCPLWSGKKPWKETNNFKVTNISLGRPYACRVSLAAQSCAFLPLCKRSEWTSWVCNSKMPDHVMGMSWYNEEQDLKRSLQYSFSHFWSLREAPNPPWYMNLLGHPHYIYFNVWSYIYLFYLSYIFLI